VGRVFSPLDEELELGPGAFSPFLMESIARLGTRLPFEQVPDELAFFTDVRVGEETARRQTESAGAALLRVEAADYAQWERDCPPVPVGPPVQQLSVDGAMVPLVHKEWAEVKSLALGSVGTRRSKGEVVACTRELSYCSRLTDADHFRDLVAFAAHRRGTARAERVCAVADGALWIQRVWDWCCPQAVRILDFPHAAEHLSAAAQARYGAGSARAQSWLDTQLHELDQGDPDRVLAALRTLPAEEPGVTAAKVCGEELAYLETRRAQLAYADFHAQGYPIGSGIVESANKLVVEARLKGAGMHWARPNVNPMVALRAMYCSSRWGERWPLIWRELRALQAAKRARRCLARHADSSASTPTAAGCAPGKATPARAQKPTPLHRLPKKGLVADGRPTAAHPFKRRPAVRRHAPGPDHAKG
jgi:hypothetical protein